MSAARLVESLSGRQLVGKRSRRVKSCDSRISSRALSSSVCSRARSFAADVAETTMKKAEKGDAHAQHILGIMYEKVLTDFVSDLDPLAN